MAATSDYFIKTSLRQSVIVPLFFVFLFLYAAPMTAGADETGLTAAVSDPAQLNAIANPPVEADETPTTVTPAVAQDTDEPPQAAAEAAEAPSPAVITAPASDENKPVEHEESLKHEEAEATKKAHDEALKEESLRHEKEEAEAAKKAHDEALKKEREAAVNKKTLEVSEAVVAGDYEKLISLIPQILSERPDLSSRLTPLIAYAYYKTGNTANAVSVLDGALDANALLARAVITGETVTLPASNEVISGGAGLFAIRVGVPAAPGFETIAYKKSLLKALKDAYLQQIGGKNGSSAEIFDRTIAPSAEKYYLSHYILSQHEDGGDSYAFDIVIFIDTARLRKTLENLGAGTTEPGAEHHLRTILLSKKGAEPIKKTMLADLLKAGFPVDDMGTGELSPETVDKTRGAIIIQVSAETVASAALLNSSLKSIKASLDFTFINGNNGLVISKLSKSYTLVHPNEAEGKDAALRKAYEKTLTPLKDAITDIETRMGKDIASGLLPQVEASVRDVKEVFSNIYKSYSDEPIGTLVLKNNTNNEFKSIRAAFSIKGYMDYPTETVIDRLGAKEEKQIPIKAVFNNRVLDLTDNTLLQSEIEVRYAESGGADKTIKVRQPIQMYEKHALVWDDKGKVASFITYKDPVVSGFATKAVREYNYPYLPSSIVMARALFGAMGALGITYVPDPVPYAAVANVTSMVDRVQYPRQTLTRKAGDCDDLVSLLTAALESLGIKAMPIDAPGHLFMAFDTGIAASDTTEFGFSTDLYIVYDGTIWIPFETTLVGSPFFLAWEKGAENYNKWKNDVKLIDIRKAWKTYAPATLPPDEFKQNVSMAAIEKKFPGELDNLRKRRIENIVKKSPKTMSVEEKKDAIISYGKNGMLNEAIKLAEDLLNNGGANDPDLLNNLGNLYFMNANYDGALKSYLDAAKHSPKDPRILVNVARTYLRLGQTKKAVEAFDKAVALDPDVKVEYLRLHTEIGK